MRYALAMADEGSISSAARTLNVTQPTLSSSLRELEYSLGVKLFLRSRGRPLTLTPEGRVLFPEIRRLVQHSGEVEHRAEGLAAPYTGTVRVGSLVTIAPVLLAPLLRAFRDRRPDAGFNVTTGNQEELLTGLRNGDLHVALTYDLDLDEGVDFQPIAAVPPKVLLPASHLLAGRRAVKLSALAKEPFILLDLPLSRDYFTGVFLAAGLSMRPSFRCSDLSFVRSLVVEGFGYSIVNLVPLDHAASSALAYVPIEGNVPRVQLGFAAVERKLSGTAEEFRTMATAMLPGLLSRRRR